MTLSVTPEIIAVTIPTFLRVVSDIALSVDSSEVRNRHAVKSMNEYTSPTLQHHIAHGRTAIDSIARIVDANTDVAARVVCIVAPHTDFT